jgi:putative transposase
MSFKYWTGGHTIHRLQYHIVFIPKYRHRVLKGKIAKDIQHIFYEATKVNGWWVEELKIMEDHVHLVIQIHPRESVAEVVQLLKGGSSRLLRKIYEDSEEFIWGKEFWADGYFAETVGVRTIRLVKQYIKENREIMPQ